MKKYVARITLTMLIGVSIIFVGWAADSRANSQQPDRIVVRKPWPIEPVKVVAIKTTNKANVELGKAFAEDDDWLDGFTVTVANNSDKIVTAMTIEMIFRRDQGDLRPPLGHALHFGPSASGPEYLHRDPNKVIRVGDTVELSLSTEDYKSLKRDFEQTGYQKNGIKRVELVIREIGFEDGSMLHTGTFYVQDPAYPTDPSKKIEVVAPPGAQNQKTRSPPNRESVIDGFSFLKTSLTLPTPVPSEECRPKEWQPRHVCAGIEACSISRDILAPFGPGNYSTALQFWHCQKWVNNNWVDCSTSIEDVERYVWCSTENSLRPAMGYLSDE